MQQHHSPQLQHLARAVHGALFALAAGTMALPALAAGLPPIGGSAAYSYQIPQGPLAEAMTSFASAARVSLVMPPALVQGKTSAGLRGNYTVQQGFEQLLRNSGLEVVSRGDGAYALRRTDHVTAVPEAVMPEISVMAAPEQENPVGPIAGYVAKRGSTGSKGNAALDEIPQSISVITRDRMDDQGVRSIGDSLQYTAGVRTNQGGANPADDSMTVRGFGQHSVDFFVDGLRLMPFGSFSFFSIEPFGAERLEVLKGPASVLYGQNSPGGVVNTVMKRPVEDRQRLVELSLGTRQRVQGGFDVGGPANDDKSVLYRVVGMTRSADQPTDHMQDDRVYLNGSATVKLDAQTELTAGAIYQKNHAMYTTNYPYQLLDGTNPQGRMPRHRFVGEPGFDHEETEFMAAYYDVRKRFGNGWEVRQNARFASVRNYEQYLQRSYDATIEGVLDREYSMRADNGLIATIDNQLHGAFQTGAAAHQVLFGLDYNWSQSDFWLQYGNVAPINVYRPVYGTPIDTTQLYYRQDRKQTNQQLGVYAQDQIKLARWILTLGGRYDWARQKYDAVNRNGTHAVTGTVDIQPQWNAFSGRAGIGYQLDNGLVPYASFSQSFVPVAGTTSMKRGSTPFKPEYADQFEIGMKYQPEGTASSLTASLFEIRRSNVTTTDPDDIKQSVQQGEVRSRGLELESIHRVNRAFSLISSYTYTDAKVTKANPDMWGTNTLGKHSMRVPAHLASVWGDYTIQAGPLAGFGTGIGVRYMGSTFGDEENTFKVPAYTLADLTLRYDLARLGPQWKGLSASLTAKNVFDKYYVAACFAAVACNLGEGRNAVAKLSYKW